MKGDKGLIAGAVLVAALAGAGPAQAHPIGTITGTATNTQGNTLTMNGGFVAGVGTGTLTLNGQPMVILCMLVTGDGPPGLYGHEFELNAGVRTPLGFTSLVYIRIVDDHPISGDLFGVGPAVLGAPCDADVGVYPLSSGSFTVI